MNKNKKKVDETSTLMLSVSSNYRITTISTTTPNVHHTCIYLLVSIIKF